MKKQFLEKFFPTSQAARIKKEIYGISQVAGKSLFEYLERFQTPVCQFSQSLDL